MNCPKLLNRTADQFTRPFSAIPLKLSFACLLLALATPSMGAWKTEEETGPAYVDSIHSWGAWELDIEPAAGGLTPPSNQALKARDTKVTLRTNSITALAPPITLNAPMPPSIPSTPPSLPPVAPVTPPTIYIPTVTSVSPTVPIPVGAP